MTLQELFIKIKYAYERSGARRAKEDVGQIDKEVKKTGKSLDDLNRKFNAMGIAAAAAAGAGIAAYTRLNAVMVEFSGKSGQSLSNFRQFTKEADRIARRTGMANESAIEQYQRIYSLGGTRRQANQLVGALGILESRGVVQGALAAEASMSMQNLGLGNALSNLQMTFAAGQTGPGNMPEYFQYAQLLSGVAGGIANLPLDQILGALTVVAAGGKMSTGASGLEEVISQLFRDPEGRRSAYYTEQTGGQWGDMQKILEEGGLFGFVQHMASHFNEDDLFKLFGSKEAARSIALLMSDPSKLKDNIDAINAAARGDAIGAFGQDTQNEISVVMKSLREVFVQFLEQFGRPFSLTIAPLLKRLGELLSAILSLNEATNGLLAWFVAIGSSFLFLPLAFRGLRRGIGAIASIGGALTDLASGRGGGRDDSRRFDEKSLGSGFGSALIGGGIGAMFMGGLRSAYGGARSLFGSTGGMLGSFFSAVKDGGWSGGHGSMLYEKTRSTLAIKIVRIGVALALAPAIRLLGLILASFGFFAAYSKLFEPNLKSISLAHQRDAQADYFRAGGARGGEPAPGWADIAEARRAMAAAERNILFEQVVDLMRDFISSLFFSIKAKLPDFVVKILDVIANAINSVVNTIFGFFHDFWVGVGVFVRELFADPRSALAGAWDVLARETSEFASSIMRGILTAFGDGASEEAESIRGLAELSSSNELGQPTIRLTRKQLEAFGITGDYSGIADAPNVNLINLPTPPNELVPTRPVLNMNFNMGDINIQGEHADDRFDTAKKVQDAIRTELRNSADYIIQEMDALSP